MAEELGQEQENKGTLQKMIVATDLHYLSPSLTDYGPVFDQLMSSGDGKLTEHGGEILEELLDRVREEGADTLLLLGDLTFNGEYQSLLDLKKSFEAAREEGIKICVIPGNHDIAYPYACKYVGEKAYRVKAITQEDFLEQMGEFGYLSGSRRDPHSFSYVYPINEKASLLFLDANTQKAPGRILEQTLTWLHLVLEEEQREGRQVIVLGHQNFLPHSTLFSSGFVLANGEEVAHLLRCYQVKLCLSGHAHLQHTQTQDGLTDICTESLSVSPLPYGVLTIDQEGEASYQRKNLSIYQAQAKERFYQVVGNQVKKTLEGKALTQVEKNAMVSFAQEVNLAYFSGTLTEAAIAALKGGTRWRLWEKRAKDTFWYTYMKSYLG